MPNPTPKPPVASLSALVSALCCLDLDRDTLLKTSGIDPDVLANADPKASSPPGAMDALWEAGQRLTGLDHLPARAGLAVPFGAFGLVDYLVGSAPDLGSCLTALQARSGGYAQIFSFEFDANAAELRILGSSDLPHFVTEFSLAVSVNRIRSLTAGTPVSLRVWLTGPAQGEALSEIYGAPVRYDSSVGRLELRKEDLLIRNRQSDPNLFRTLDGLATQLGIGPAGPHFLGAVKSALREQLSSGEADAASVAKSLAMSERSLSRRLAEANMSFRAILDELRAAEAERHLEAGRSIAATALAVGYADQSAFTRAFRRWKGVSPREWLRQAE